MQIRECEVMWGKQKKECRKTLQMEESGGLLSWKNNWLSMTKEETKIAEDESGLESKSHASGTLLNLHIGSWF